MSQGGRTRFCQPMRTLLRPPPPVHTGKSSSCGSRHGPGWLSWGRRELAELEPDLQAGSSCPGTGRRYKRWGKICSGGQGRPGRSAAGLAGSAPLFPGPPPPFMFRVGWFPFLPPPSGSRLALGTARMVLIKSFRPQLRGRKQSLCGASPDPGLGGVPSSSETILPVCVG